MLETEGPLEKAVLFYTGSAIFYANSYEECLKFTADDKIERDSQAHAYYEVLYNEVIFGEVYDGIIKVVHTE